MRNITRAIITDRNNITTIRLVGYEYKEIATVMVQIMDMATTWADKPATIIAVDFDSYSISFKGVDGITIMAYTREFVQFDETVELMRENGIACQWEMSNW